MRVADGASTDGSAQNRMPLLDIERPEFGKYPVTNVGRDLMLDL
jgi:hypothetical protein